MIIIDRALIINSNNWLLSVWFTPRLLCDREMRHYTVIVWVLGLTNKILYIFRTTAIHDYECLHKVSTLRNWMIIQSMFS